jgi:pimeloyl-ACP methyl ester carboxylesterase
MPSRDIATLDVGSGPPVLLVHGLGGFKESWGRVPDLIAATGHRSVAIDLPGWGESPGSRREPHTADWYARRLLPLVGELDRPLVVGHSLGAQVATMMALRVPGSLSGLVLVSPQVVRRAQQSRRPRVPQDWAALPLIGPLASRLFFRAFLRDDARLERGFAAVVSDRRRFAEDPAARALLEQAKQRFRATSPGVWAKALNCGLRLDLRDVGRRLETPTVVIVGDADRITRPATAISLARSVPAARLSVLAGVGHLPQIEAPERLVDQLGFGHSGATESR